MSTHNPDSEPQWLTLPQVAATYQIGVSTIRSWVAEGRLPVVKVGKLIRVSKAEFEKAMFTRIGGDA